MAIELLQSRNFSDGQDEDGDMPSDNSPIARESPASDGGDSSDTSSSLTEVPRDEFPSYFSERNGRLYSSNSHGGPYPLPVDGPEQARLKVQHNMLRLLFGANYIGPVPELLARESGGVKRVLDLCTGTGTWVMEMANEFPHVQFSGIDIVPIASMYPPPNVLFEMHDINEPLRWSDNTMDFVHARDIAMACDIHAVVHEVTRVLRPGGLFLSCEWSHQPAFQSSVHVNRRTAALRACEFFDALDIALRRRGILAVDRYLPSLLAMTGRFRQIVPLEWYVPIGGWHSDPRLRFMGETFKRFIGAYAESMLPVLIESGCSREAAGELLRGLMLDLGRTSGMVGVYRTVYARKA